MKLCLPLLFALVGVSPMQAGMDSCPECNAHMMQMPSKMQMDAFNAMSKKNRQVYYMLDDHSREMIANAYKNGMDPHDALMDVLMEDKRQKMASNPEDFKMRNKVMMERQQMNSNRWRN